MKKQKQILSSSWFAAPDDNMVALNVNYAQSKIFLFFFNYFCFKHNTEHFRTLIELIYAIVCHLWAFIQQIL